MTQFEGLSDAELSDEITTWAGRIAAGEARMLALLAEFDKREAWFGPGMLSCAHWLSWRLGMGLVAAHERVRVARALPGLPLVAAAYQAGQLSWTQIRAITRVADAAEQPLWLELARHATGAQIEKLVRGVRRARKIVEDESDPDRSAWAMRTRISYDADGTLVLTLRMAAQHGAVVLAALEQARANLDAGRPRSSAEAAPRGGAPARPDDAGRHDDAARPDDAARHNDTARPDDTTRHDDAIPSDALPAQPILAAPAALPAVETAPEGLPTPTARPVRATLSEALLQLALDSLSGGSGARTDPGRRRRARLVAHIDPLSGWSRLPDGELLPAGVLLLPEPGRPVELRRLTNADLTAQDLGRGQRTPSPALRELLTTVDGQRCRFPGCGHRRNLHAHHVVYWSDEGRTDLANLLLLCPRHHTLVHVEGFRLQLSGRTLSVATAAGTPVPHHPLGPWRPAHELDPAYQVTAGTLPPAGSADRLDLRYAVSVLVQQAA